MFPLDRTSLIYFTSRLSRHLLVSGVLFLLYLIYHTSYPMSTCFLIFSQFYFFFLYIVYISYIFLNIHSFRVFINVLDKHLVESGAGQSAEHPAQNHRRRYRPSIQPDGKDHSENRADRRNVLIVHILDPLFHNIPHTEADSHDYQNKIF